MQLSYIAEVNQAPVVGEVWDGLEVVDVSSEFPEDGFSYDDMWAGNCRAYVRVTLQSI